MNVSAEAIILACIAALPGLIALIGQLRKDFAASKKTSSEREQLEAEITEKVLKRANDEIEKYQNRISDLEAKLSASGETIEQLRQRDRERERTMANLQEQFSRDAMLRANIETALAAANEKITDLSKRLDESQRRIKQLEDELKKRDEEIAQLKAKNGRGLLKHDS